MSSSRVDTHQHIVPPAYRKILDQRQLTAGGWPTPDWSFEAVEYATVEWFDLYNQRRLLEPIGNIPPDEAEAAFYTALGTTPMSA